MVVDLLEPERLLHPLRAVPDEIPVPLFPCRFPGPKTSPDLFCVGFVAAGEAVMGIVLRRIENPEAQEVLNSFASCLLAQW